MLNETPSDEVTLIVGAGMAGLTAGFLLSREGERCLLLEKEATVGGGCRTHILDDIVFDLGPHLFFYNPDLEAERFIMDLLDSEETIKKRTRFAIYNDGIYWKFPLSVFDLLLYPWEFKKQIFLSFLKKNKPPNDLISIEEDIIEKGGRSYYETVFAPMLLKKTLSRGSKIHRDWVARVDRNVKNRKEPFEEISRGNLFQKIVRPFYQPYYYPLKGFERLPVKLREKYENAGGKTILNCGTITFEKNEGKIKSVAVKDKTYILKNVIWTGSINELNRVLGGNLQKINYVKTIIVMLTYNQKKRVRRPFVYVHYPNQSLIFNRIYFPSHIFGNRSAEGKEGICMELNYRDDLDNIKDRDIIQRTVEDIEKLGLFKKDELRQKRLIRLGECLPVYALDYESKMQEAFKEVHSYRNLYSVGRLGGYFFCMTPPAVSQGIKMAKHILKINRD